MHFSPFIILGDCKLWIKVSSMFTVPIFCSLKYWRKEKKLAKLVAIGKISKSHGLKGEVKVVPLTSYPERFEQLEKVTLEYPNGNKTEIKLKKTRYSSNGLIIVLEGVNDRNASDALVGSYLNIPETELIELKKDEFFVFDLIGLRVETESGVYLGKVTDLIPVGESDVYVIKREEDKKEFLIPSRKEFVSSVNLKDSLLVVKPIDGMIE